MCVIMHAIWDMPIEIDYYLVQIAMTVCAWVVTLVLVDVGLKEISKINIQKNDNNNKTQICEKYLEKVERES